MKNIILALLMLCVWAPVASGGMLIQKVSSAGGSCTTEVFTDNDDTLLNTHDNKWTSISTTYAVSMVEIISNQAINVNTYTKGGAYYDNAQTADPQYVSIKYLADSGSYVFAPCVRCDTNTTGYGIRLTNESSGNFTRVYYYKDVNGTATAQTYDTVSIPANANHVLYLKVEDDGSNDPVLSVWIDDNSGAADQDWTDTGTPITGGHPGFWGYIGGATKNKGDDWSDCSW